MAHGRKPYSRGSQPYVMERWLNGVPNPGRVRPKHNMPYRGVMMPLDVYSLEVRDDGCLYGYGTKIGTLKGTTVQVPLEVPTASVASIARSLVGMAERMEFKVVIVGPDGLALTAAKRRLLSIQKQRKQFRDHWSATWRLAQAMEQVKAITPFVGFGIDAADLFAVIDAWKNTVVVGRLRGWSEDTCTSMMQRLMAAQHGVEVSLPEEKAA